MSFFQWFRPRPQHKTIVLNGEIDREEDGRWIAEVTELPGVLAYGDTKDEAVHKAVALAYRVLADQVEHGERPAPSEERSFQLCVPV